MKNITQVSQPPVVSIIITCYNYGRFLSQAIDSALSQSFQSVEVIVIDDGSTDNSQDIAESYGSKIIYVRQENAGVVAARNSGFKKSKGCVICFLDADDYLHPKFIELLLPPLMVKRREVDLAYSDVEYVDLQSGIFRPKKWNPHRLLFENYIINCALMTRESFESAGMYSNYMTGQYGFEDWELWIKFVKRHYKGSYIPKALYYYRIHGKGRNDEGEQNRQQQIELIKSHHPEIYQNKRIMLMVRISQVYWLARRKVATTTKRLIGRE